MVYVNSNTPSERVHVLALDPTRSAVIGATLVMKVWRSSDGQLLDFADSTFKASGHTSLTTTLIEHSVANNPGVYYAAMPIATITNAVADDVYSFRIDQSAGTTAVNVPALGEVRVGRWVDTINTNLDTTMSSRATSASAATAVWGTSVPGAFGAGTAGAKLDVVVSTRAVAGDAMALVTDAVNSTSLATSAVNEIQAGLATSTEVAEVAGEVWGTALPGAFAGGTAGANLGVAVSTRAAPGDAMTLVANSITAAVVATDAVAELQSGLATAAALSTVGANVIATPAAVWDVVTSGHVTNGTFGHFLSIRLDVATSTRTVPGDAMTLAADAVNSTSLATSAVTEIQSGLSTAAGVAAIPAAVWNVAQSGYASGSTTFGWALRTLRILATNRIAETPGTPGSMIIYADDATTPFLTYTLTDFNGNGLFGMVGAPARRAAGVTP